MTRILWVARAPAPYRYPVWHAIARNADLTVAFLHPEGIGRAWQIQVSQLFEQVVLPARGPAYREDALWFLPFGHAARVVDGCDIVYLQGAWETPAFWQIARAAKRRKIRCVLFYESTIASMHHRGGLVGVARAYFMSQMHHVVTPGLAASDAVLASSVEPARLTTSVNVVDVARFRRLAERSRTGPPASGHRFIAVAQLIERKNLDTLIRAFARIYRPQDELEIIGSGPQREGLMQLIAKLGLRSRVRLVGYLAQDEVAERYGYAQTLVLPSIEEVWGLVVNEALASGLSCVVSTSAGVASTVADMPGVYLTSPEEGALAKAMVIARDNWDGWITNPPILGHNADRLAGDLLRAADSA